MGIVFASLIVFLIAKLNTKKAVAEEAIKEDEKIIEKEAIKSTDTNN